MNEIQASNLKLYINYYDINKLKVETMHNEPIKLTFTMSTLYLLHVK